MAPTDPEDWLTDPTPPDADASDRSISPPPEEPLTACWRCGKFVAPAERCSVCRARLAGRGYSITPPPSRFQTPVLAILAVMAILLGTNVIGGWIAQLQFRDTDTTDTFVRSIPLLTVLSVIDAIIVVWAWVIYRRECRVAAPGAVWVRLVTILGGVPLLGLAMGLNLMYHRVLQDFVGLPETPEMVGWQLYPVAAILLVCVMPAWFEELFFRQLVLGSLIRHMSPHAAVLISALTFGLAHIGVPLSVPYLTFLGVILGYLRLGSGTLLVPIVFHGIHNYLVLILNGS